MRTLHQLQGRLSLPAFAYVSVFSHGFGYHLASRARASLPLSPLARSIIKSAINDEVRPEKSPFVFSTTGKTSVSGFAKAKKRLDKLIAETRFKAAQETGSDFQPMPHWTFHDLRSSFTTLACERLSIDAAVADRILNHVATATTSKIMRIYNMSELFEPRRQALRAWEAFLLSHLRATDDQKVVQMRPAAA